MRALVTGATGFVGGHLVDALVERGARVRCLVRRSSDTARLQQLGVELAVGDVADPGSPGAAVAGVDVVFHLAAMLKQPWHPDFMTVNADGVRHVMGDKKVQTPVDVLEGFEFTPDLARTYRRARENPLELSFSEIQDLMQRDPDNVVYQTLWQYQLTFPLANLVLLLVGLPAMMAHERRRTTDRMVLGGLLCLFYFGTDFVSRNLGLEGDLSPLLASWTPVLLFGSLGVVLFESMRT